MKLTSGFFSLATALAPKCTINGGLQTAIGEFACVAPTKIGTSICKKIVPVVLKTEAAPFSAMSISSNASNLLHTIRGGVAPPASAVIDISRESLHSQGLATYATITALIMNASLRLWTSTNFSKDQKKIVSDVFNFATALCIMSGSFTAILFQLLTIYSKSALAMGNDEGYLVFKAATKCFRIWGFRCFLTEAISFAACFLSRLYNTLWEDARDSDCKSSLTASGKLVMGGSILFMLFGVSIIRSVLNLASQHIFCTAA